MTILSLPYSFTPLTTADANQVNANFVAVVTWANGNITDSNVNAAAGISLSKLGLNPGGAAFNKSTTTAQTWGSGLTTDSVPRLVMTTDNGLAFGPGAAGALDVYFQRSAANTLQLNINNTGTGGATLDMHGGTISNATLSGFTLSGSVTVTQLTVSGGVLTSGVNGGSGGTLVLKGSTSGSFTFTVAAAAGAVSLQAPTAVPTLNNAMLTATTAGVLSFRNTPPRFTSTGNAFPAFGGTVTVPHGFGLVPAKAWISVVNVTTQGGYVTGDTVIVMGALTISGTSGNGFSIWCDATNVNVVIGASGITIANKTTGAPTTIATSSALWTITVYAEP